MTPRERNAAFKLVRKAKLAELVKLHRAAASDTQMLMARALDEIKAELGRTTSEFQSWQLARIRKSIEGHLAEISEALARTATTGAGEAWKLGVGIVDDPLEAGGIRIAGLLPEVDTRQLLAMRTFLTDKIKGVTANAAGAAADQIGLTMIGAQTPSQAIDAIATTIDSGRGRAITVLRTEMGRAFSVAAQERKVDAATVLPGMRKQWRRSGKVQSRQAHDLADGQIVEVDKPFLVNGVELMFPRDPSAPASETVNCGCVSLPYMETWEVQQRGRQAFTDDELARSRSKRDLEGALTS
ncbi:MAG: phage minor head protein [Thalassobaculaceae bacterium]